MILTLARGNYCPKEHRQHLELAGHYPEIAVAYTQVATIATDDHHTLQEFRASVGAQWPFLSDPGRIVQKDLRDLRGHGRDRPDWDLSTPGLREAWDAGDYSKSADIGAVVRETAALTARPFGGNFVLTSDHHHHLDQALEAGLRVVSFFLGDPGGYVEAVHDAGGMNLRQLG